MPEYYTYDAFSLHNKKTDSEIQEILIAGDTKKLMRYIKKYPGLHNDIFPEIHLARFELHALKIIKFLCKSTFLRYETIIDVLDITKYHISDTNLSCSLYLLRYIFNSRADELSNKSLTKLLIGAFEGHNFSIIKYIYKELDKKNIQINLSINCFLNICSDERYNACRIMYDRIISDEKKEELCKLAKGFKRFNSFLLKRFIMQETNAGQKYLLRLHVLMYANPIYLLISDRQEETHWKLPDYLRRRAKKWNRQSMNFIKTYIKQNDHSKLNDTYDYGENILQFASCRRYIKAIRLFLKCGIDYSIYDFKLLDLKDPQITQFIKSNNDLQ